MESSAWLPTAINFSETRIGASTEDLSLKRPADEGLELILEEYLNEATESTIQKPKLSF